MNDEDKPCPVCGSEERHERTGLLLCECPCPVTTQLIGCRRELELAKVRISNQDYMLANRQARLDAAAERNLALVTELAVLRAVVGRLRRTAERLAVMMPGGIMMHPSAVLRILGARREADGSAG